MASPKVTGGRATDEIRIHALHTTAPDTSYSYGPGKKSAIGMVGAKMTCVQEVQIVRSLPG